MTPEADEPTLDRRAINQLRVRRRAERMLEHPSEGPALNRIRDELLRIADEAAAAIDAVDRSIGALIRLRRLLVDRLLRARRAAAGGRSARTHPLASSFPQVPRPGAAVIARRMTAPDIRAEAIVIIESIGAPLSAAEIAQLMVMAGWSDVTGDATKAVSDALRPAVKAARVQRVTNGWYAPGPPVGADWQDGADG